ncbi:MAG: hypothetical protein RL338_1436 [Chloroflexota bacterium]|jgi:pyridoxamine 5'-phosphate oxidase family protein
MSVFTDAELAYLAGQPLGRFATVGADGAPHVVPVTFRYNPETDTIDFGGWNLTSSKKWRDIAHEPRVAFVVDDVLPPWQPRLIEIRGTAQQVGDELIRITPTRIVAFGLDARSDPRQRVRGREVPAR